MIRPLDSQSESSDSFDPSPYISDLFACTIKRLKAADIDQEVKERAISCMGQIICNLGDRLPAELPGTLLIFLERLKNEITRLTTVKGKPRPPRRAQLPGPPLTVTPGSSDADRRLAPEDRPEARAAGRRPHPRLLPAQEPAGAQAVHARRPGHPAQELQVRSSPAAGPAPSPPS